MNGHAIVSPSGIKGFDCNSVVTTQAGRALHALGHRFAVRYVRRSQPRVNDISEGEIAQIFPAGLALMIVQHVESDRSWKPDDTKGAQYGDNAASSCLALGIPRGVTVWLDLEGVAEGTDAEQIIRYCNIWYDRVAAVGYQPGIYVGWHAGLTPDQLYKRLKFSRYWAAYNLNRDQEPAVRGVCMKQREPTVPESQAVTFPIDGNSIRPDKAGDLPTLFAPEEWDGR
jgi:hypothetical protein